MKDKKLSEVKPSIAVIAAVVFVFLTINMGIASLYYLQIIAILLLIYLFSLKKKHTYKWLEVFSITSFILLIIALSGGLTSPLFFLLYILIFSLSLTAAPLTGLAFSIGAVIFFLATFSSQSGILTTNAYLSILALPFITPMAVYIGKEHLRNKYLENAISSEKQKSRHKRNKLVCIKEETLLWFGTVFTSHINSINSAIQNLNFPIEQNLNDPDDWKIIKHQMKRIKTLSKRLTSYVEESKL